MNSSERQYGADNPSFTRELTFELSERQRLDSETQLIPEDSSFTDFPDYQESAKIDCNYLQLPSPLPRNSVTTVLSTPVVQLNDFLRDARHSVLLSPDELSELSLSDLEVLRDNNQRATFFSKFKRVMQSFPVNLFTMFCILTDTGIIIADVTLYGLSYANKMENLQQNISDDTTHERGGYVIADFSLSVYLLIELLLCIAATGWREFICVWQNDLDAFITVVSFTFSLMDLIAEDESIIEAMVIKYRILQVARLCRLFRIIRVFRLYTLQMRLAKAARHLVSRNKRRYQNDGFDLDLTYVTDKIIAMSFPSTGRMSLYRNPITDVARFLDTKHPGHYKVYNLCDEHSYDPSYFHGRVERFPFKDHNVPSVKQMMEFTASVRAWLAADPNNVIAVHCKGGKGRTGTMVCVWLVEAEVFLRAEDSLVYFGSRRTDTAFGLTFQGVETPSQCRYVEYYERIKDNGGILPTEIALKPEKIRIEGISKIGKGDGSDFIIEFYTANNAKSPIYKTDFSKKRSGDLLYFYFPNENAVECTLVKCPSLQGDVQVVVRSRSRTAPRGCLGAVFYFWFHCNFIQDYRIHLKREQLDNPHKPSSWRYFGPEFAVQLDFVKPAHRFLDLANKYRTCTIRESVDFCLSERFAL